MRVPVEWSNSLLNRLVFFFFNLNYLIGFCHLKSCTVGYTLSVRTTESQYLCLEDVFETFNSTFYGSFIKQIELGAVYFLRLTNILRRNACVYSNELLCHNTR